MIAVEDKSIGEGLEFSQDGFFFFNSEGPVIIRNEFHQESTY